MQSLGHPSQVEYDTCAIESRAESGARYQVSQYGLGVLGWQMTGGSSPRAGCPKQAADIGAFTQEPLHQVAPDEARSSSDQNGSAAQAIHVGPTLLPSSPTSAALKVFSRESLIFESM